MKVECTIRKCNNCWKHLTGRYVFVIDPSHDDLIEVDTPKGPISIGRGDDCHFCSVDCLCEFIRVKASELGAA